MSTQGTDTVEAAVRNAIAPFHEENIAVAAAWRANVDNRLEALEEKAEKHEAFQVACMQTHGQMLGYFDQLLGSPLRPQIPGLIPQIIADGKERDAKDSKRWHTLNNALQSLVDKGTLETGARLGQRRMRGWIKWGIGIAASIGGAFGGAEVAKKVHEILK